MAFKGKSVRFLNFYGNVVNNPGSPLTPTLDMNVPIGKIGVCHEIFISNKAIVGDGLRGITDILWKITTSNGNEVINKLI